MIHSLSKVYTFDPDIQTLNLSFSIYLWQLLHDSMILPWISLEGEIGNSIIITFFKYWMHFWWTWFRRLIIFFRGSRWGVLLLADCRCSAVVQVQATTARYMTRSCVSHESEEAGEYLRLDCLTDCYIGKEFHHVGIILAWIGSDTTCSVATRTKTVASETSLSALVSIFKIKEVNVLQPRCK